MARLRLSLPPGGSAATGRVSLEDELVLVTQPCPTLCDPRGPARLPCPWDSSGQNTGAGSRSLLQGIFPSQGSNPGLPRILYQLSHQGNPRILEWLAYHFSNGSSDPGIEPGSPTLQADSSPAEPPGRAKRQPKAREEERGEGAPALGPQGHPWEEGSRTARGGSSGPWSKSFSSVHSLRRVQLFATPWTIARLFCPWNSPGKNTGVSKPSPSPGDLPDPGIKPRSPALQAHSIPSDPPEVCVYG